MIIRFSSLCFAAAFSLVLLRQALAATATNNGSPSVVLPVGREAMITHHVVEQLRGLRSKPAVDNDNSSSEGKGSKGSKKMKKKEKLSKAMEKSIKGSKGVKADLESDDGGGGDDDDDDGDDDDDESIVNDNGGDEVDNEESEPVESFDISNCDSYSNDWLLELADFCGPDLEDLTGCRCPTAGDLLAEGALTCARPDQKNSSPPACPTGCPVCEFCMVLEGCEDIYDC